MYMNIYVNIHIYVDIYVYIYICIYVYRIGFTKGLYTVVVLFLFSGTESPDIYKYVYADKHTCICIRIYTAYMHMYT